MKRTWTTVGLPVVPEDRRDEVSQYLDGMEWKPVEGLELGMSQGMAMQEAIKQLRIPRVSHVADDNRLAPFGLYGARGHYKNGRVDVFLVDRGTDCLVLATDFYPEG